MHSPTADRLRIFALCNAVLFRVVAYTSVAVLTIKSLQNGSFTIYKPGALAAWLFLIAVPVILFAPIAGPLAASRGNRFVRIIGSAIVVAVLGWATVNDDVPWLSIAAILSLEAAFFASAYSGVAWPMAKQANLWVVTLQWLVILFAVTGILLVAFPISGSTFLEPRAALIASILSFIAIVFVGGSPNEPVNLAASGLLRPFMAVVRDTARNGLARSGLIGLCVWSFVTLAALTVLIRTDDTDQPIPETSIFVYSIQRLERSRFLWAMAAGVLFSGLNRHPFRHAGYIIFGALMVAAGSIWLRFDDGANAPQIMLGFALGMTLSPLIQLVLNNTTPKFHGIAASCMIACMSVSAIALAIVVFNLGSDPPTVRAQLLNILIGVTGIAAIASIPVLFRPALEVTGEVILWPFYRVRLIGSAAENLPRHGPCLVIGNHASWFDPLFLCKAMPAPTTPMMTSKFYDLPVLSFLMRRIIGTIRVPDVPYRHEAPELKEAIAALDRGEYVLLFPEGYLRRKEEVPLRRFARGVWKILSDRPTTPVFACWIEGAWGSFTSYRGGPPAKGKRVDLLRLIRIGIVGPITIDAATLDDHMATRKYLMQKVLDAREPLGLPPLDLNIGHAEDENE